MEIGVRIVGNLLKIPKICWKSLTILIKIAESISVVQQPMFRSKIDHEFLLTARMECHSDHALFEKQKTRIRLYIIPTDATS